MMSLVFFHDSISKTELEHEQSQVLTDTHDVNLTDNEFSVCDKLYQ